MTPGSDARGMPPAGKVAHGGLTPRLAPSPSGASPRSPARDTRSNIFGSDAVVQTLERSMSTMSCRSNGSDFGDFGQVPVGVARRRSEGFLNLCAKGRTVHSARMQGGEEVKTSLGVSASLSNLAASECGDSAVSNCGSAHFRRRSEEGYVNMDAKGRTSLSARMHQSDDIKQAMSQNAARVQRRSSAPMSPMAAWKQDDSQRDDQSVTSTVFTYRSRAQGQQGSPRLSQRTPRLSNHSQSTVSECLQGPARSVSPPVLCFAEGVAITARGHSSSNIPWRQLPAYDERGAIQSTGNLHASPDSLKKDRMMDRKKVATFSPVLARSQSVAEVLDTVREPARRPSHSQSMESFEVLAPEPPGFPGVSANKAREVWMDLVHRRTGGSHLNLSPRCSSPGDVEGAWGSEGRGSPQGSVRGSAASAVGSDGQPRQLHYAYRKQKHSPSVREPGSPGQGTKDVCPFHREDSVPEARATQTPTRRSYGTCSPRTSTPLAGVAEDRALKDEHAFVAERIADNRRDWQYQQDKPILEGSPRTPGTPVACRSPSSDKLSVSGCMTNRSLLSALSNGRASLPGRSSASDAPVHSIRPRPPTQVARRPQWRR